MADVFRLWNHLPDGQLGALYESTTPMMTEALAAVSSGYAYRLRMESKAKET